MHNPKMENFQGKRFFGNNDKTCRSPINDKLIRCAKRLPDTEIGRSIFNSLQTIRLKGNKISEDEKNVYEHFLLMLN